MIVIWEQAPEPAILDEVDKGCSFGYRPVIPQPDGLVLIFIIQAVDQPYKADINRVVEFSLVRFQIVQCMMNILGCAFKQFCRIDYDIFFRCPVWLIFTLKERNASSQKDQEKRTVLFHLCEPGL